MCVCVCVRDCLCVFVYVFDYWVKKSHLSIFKPLLIEQINNHFNVAAAVAIINGVRVVLLI